MKVYVVITNGEDIKGELEGVYQNYEDARKEFEEIKQGWLDWAGDDVIEKNEYNDNFTLETSDEYMEVKIETAEVQ